MLNKVFFMTGQMDVHTSAYQVLDKTVKSIGNSGGVLVPKKWVGKKVKILLLEEVAEEE
jgi:putative transposon-encoded protein